MAMIQVKGPDADGDFELIRRGKHPMEPVKSWDLSRAELVQLVADATRLLIADEEPKDPT